MDPLRRRSYEAGTRAVLGTPLGTAGPESRPRSRPPFLRPSFHQAGRGRDMEEHIGADRGRPRCQSDGASRPLATEIEAIQLCQSIAKKAAPDTRGARRATDTRCARGLAAGAGRGGAPGRSQGRAGRDAGIIRAHGLRAAPGPSSAGRDRRLAKQRLSCVMRLQWDVGSRAEPSAEALCAAHARAKGSLVAGRRRASDRTEAALTPRCHRRGRARLSRLRVRLATFCRGAGVRQLEARRGPRSARIHPTTGWGPHRPGGTPHEPTPRPRRSDRSQGP